PERYDVLPDGEVSRHGSFSARLIDPTERYDHGVLGDAIEAGGFMVERNGSRLIYRLSTDAVFEDRRVRLADLDGDGVPEAIVVKSYLDRGAAIAVYRLLHDRIELLAESAPIGTRNRWLNPVGVADFTGSGEAMIAAVVTPHLAGSLRLYRLAGATLGEVARIDGYTNHIIGKRDLDLAAIIRINHDGPPLIVIPALDRRSLAAIGLAGGNPVAHSRWTLPNRIERLSVDRELRATVFGDFGERRIDLRGDGGQVR
ncbi:MAG: hypothetical protein ACRCUE_04515, partial [Bosea sp. (in: a-proteobacteria)]